MHVVVMFEPAAKGEYLTLAGQVNEVFGPFDDGDKAQKWTEQMEKLIPNREWLVIPLSNLNAINAVDPQRN